MRAAAPALAPLGLGAGLVAFAARAQSRAAGRAARAAPHRRPHRHRAPAPAEPAAPARTGAERRSSWRRSNITGSRPDDVQERRQSTAAKIIIGREEIDRFGDSTLGDVLKRLPGVTIQGRPGRGGAIRLRGLGNGYTQILLDGERVPPGFSLDSLSPDQIERIEILRAPTAETGARAIAGTINIITREGYSKRVNDVRLNAAYENGKLQPSASWTRNFSEGAWTINYSLIGLLLRARQQQHDDDRRRRSTTARVTLAQVDDARAARARRRASTATARLQWRSDGGVDS